VGRLAEHRLRETRDPKVTAPVRSSKRVGQRPAAGQIVPAGTAIAALIGSGGEPLNQADAEVAGPGHRPRRVHDLGIGSVGRGAWGRSPAGSEPGGDPPKPPGTASPGTEHGWRREEPPPRARRETGAAAPGFVLGRYSQAAVPS
jgi:hypothetical protein